MREPLLGRPEQFVDQIAMSLAASASGQRNRHTVDDIADEVDRLGIMVAQKIDQPLALARAGAEVNVRQEERTDPMAEFPPGRAALSLVDSHGRTMREPCLSFTTLRLLGPNRC